MSQSPEQLASPPPSKHGRRRRTSTACEECRRRKLRCDGQQPLCAACRDSGAACEFNMARAGRGPKKGAFKELRDRIVVLENRLAEKQQSATWDINAAALTNPTSMLFFPNGQSQFPPAARRESFSTSNAIMPDIDHGMETAENMPEMLTIDSEHIMSPTFHTLDTLFTPIDKNMNELLTIENDARISPLIHSELDQLYFDRVHKFVPIIHERGYMLWSKTRNKMALHLCLQRAMWSLAAHVTAQFQHLQEPLFADTKRLLQIVSSTPGQKHSQSTELAQILVLVALSEIQRHVLDQAWITTGRAFRVVQLMKLHMIDLHPPSEESLTARRALEMEEQRRVFWMACLLDILLSSHNNLPLPLTERVVHTRLPVPESEFQGGKPGLGKFLHEEISERSLQSQCMLIECIIFADMLGRGLFHRQQFNAQASYGGLSQDWTVKYEWLNSILTSRLCTLAQMYPSPADNNCPMPLFVIMLGQTATIAMCQGVEAAPLATADRHSFITECRPRAMAAAEEVVKLAKMLPEFHVSKIHPLAPIILASCVRCLHKSQEQFPGDSPNTHFQRIIEVLDRLSEISNSSSNLIDVLGLSWLRDTEI